MGLLAKLGALAVKGGRQRAGNKKEGFALLVAGVASVVAEPVVGSVRLLGGVERPAIHPIAPDVGDGEEDFFGVAPWHRFGFGVGFFGEFSSDCDHLVSPFLFLSVCIIASMSNLVKPFGTLFY